MFKSEFESEQVFCNFRSSILTSFFCNFWKVRNRTNSEYSVNSECLETLVFDLKTGVFDPELFPNYFCKMFTSSIKPDISKKFQNFCNWTIPKLTITKYSENSVFCRALVYGRALHLFICTHTGMPFFTRLRIRALIFSSKFLHVKNLADQPSISSTFYARVFRTRFLAPKFQTQKPALYKILAPKTSFRMKNAHVKSWWNWHQVSMQNNYGINIFDNAPHDLWHIRYAHISQRK